MLTFKPTQEMIDEWKNVYEIYKNKLTPNRKSGEEINEYFCIQYQPTVFDSPDFDKVIKENIMLNEANFEKLPQGKFPEIVTYSLKDKNILIDRMILCQNS